MLVMWFLVRVVYFMYVGTRLFEMLDQVAIKTLFKCQNSRNDTVEFVVSCVLWSDLRPHIRPEAPSECPHWT